MEQKINEIVKKIIEEYNLEIEKDNLKFQSSIILMAKITMFEEGLSVKWDDMIQKINLEKDVTHLNEIILNVKNIFLDRKDEEGFEIFNSFTLTRETQIFNIDCLISLIFEINSIKID